MSGQRGETRETTGMEGAERIPVESAERGHERRDIGALIMVLFGVGLTASVVFGIVVSLFVFDAFDVERIRRERAAAERPRAPVTEPPPDPRLQVAPGEQLRELRRREEAMLDHYGWVNREAGIVRIPVERAIELLAERGLPHRDGPGTTETDDTGRTDSAVEETAGTDEDADE